jgi:hypothetical protein
MNEVDVRGLREWWREACRAISPRLFSAAGMRFPVKKSISTEAERLVLGKCPYRDAGHCVPPGPPVVPPDVAASRAEDEENEARFLFDYHAGVVSGANAWMP